MRVAAVAGCQPYERLTPAAAATVLLSDRGARKELPPSGRLAVVVNKVAEANERLVGELLDALAAMEPAVPVVALGFDPDLQPI